MSSDHRATRSRRVSRWLRGSASASPSGNYVVIAIEGKHGLYDAQVYLTRTEAKALRERLQEIEAYLG